MEIIQCKCLDTFWTRISYVFKSWGVSKQVRRLQYLVIGYKSDPLDYKWINVLFNYIGFVIYKSYFCCERRNKQSNILNVFIEELKDLETVIRRISNTICWQPFWASCVYNVQIMYSLLLHLCPGIKSWNKRTGVFSSKKKKKKQRYNTRFSVSSNRARSMYEERSKTISTVSITCSLWAK